MLDAERKAQELLKLSRQAGAESAEVYQMQTRSQMACFDANQLKQIEHRESSGIALRLWHGGCPGLSVARGDVELQSMVDQAIALSQLSLPQEVTLATTQLCSSSLDRGHPVSQTQLIDWGTESIDAILSQHYQCDCSAELSWESEDVYLVNSRGLECGYVDTTLRSFLTTEWIRGHDFLCVEANQTQRDSLDLKALTQRIQQGLTWAIRQVPAPTGQVPVLFTSHAADVLWDTIQVALNGQKVADRISPWSFGLNTAVVSPQLTLTQRPELGPYSCPFDDEGVSSHSLELIRNGRLTGFFTDQGNGQLLGMGSTGNGFRPHLHSYPVPELINLVVNPGPYHFSELLEQMDDGIIVDQILGENRRVNGDLSFNVDLGYRVQHGEVQGRVKDILMTGNVYQALNQVIALGNDNQWNDIYFSPSLLLNGFSVVPRIAVE